MSNLFPENSYMGKCSCGKEFIAPKGVIHCHNCLYQKISELENTCTQSQWISEQLVPALNKCFKSKLGCDGVLMVGVDDYNELVDLINKALPPKVGE